MQKRAALHSLVDELPEGELVTAERFLDYLRSRAQGRLEALLAEAPLDDEPVTGDDLAAIREGRDQAEHGEVVSHEEVKRRILGSAR